MPIKLVSCSHLFVSNVWADASKDRLFQELGSLKKELEVTKYLPKFVCEKGVTIPKEVWI